MKKLSAFCLSLASVFSVAAAADETPAFAFPAAGASFRAEGDISRAGGDEEAVADAVEQGGEMETFARSSGCSTRCSSGCSTSCSSSCSTRCGGGSTTKPRRGGSSFLPSFTDDEAEDEETPAAPAPGRTKPSYWVTKDKQVIHNRECKEYMEGEGELAEKPKGTACKECGGNRYWISQPDGLTHNYKCMDYRKGEGKLSKKGGDKPCPKCGGKF